eukprot:6830738-Lingulodinium_polyedra.AAC.1
MVRLSNHAEFLWPVCHCLSLFSQALEVHGGTMARQLLALLLLSVFCERAPASFHDGRRRCVCGAKSSGGREGTGPLTPLSSRSWSIRLGAMGRCRVHPRPRVSRGGKHTRARSPAKRFEAGRG